jgi:hypothetical protein
MRTSDPCPHIGFKDLISRESFPTRTRPLEKYFRRGPFVRRGSPRALPDDAPPGRTSHVSRPGRCAPTCLPHSRGASPLGDSHAGRSSTPFGLRASPLRGVPLRRAYAARLSVNPCWRSAKLLTTHGGTVHLSGHPIGVPTLDSTDGKT